MTIHTTSLTEFPCKRGKVRDVYDVGGDRLVVVATDRISAFDHVMREPIPEKGRILTNVSRFWFERFSQKYRTHFISTVLSEMPAPFMAHPKIFDGRTMIVEKCTPFPLEFIVRGYISGSAYKEYKNSGEVCGMKLPKGLKENSPLPEPLFTPSTKADTGHDVNVTYLEAVDILQKWQKQNGFTTTATRMKLLAETSIEIYKDAAKYAWERGIIIADTKFEFGLSKSGGVVLIDEVLTPDSSRYWPVEGYCLGKSPPSLDKQYLRDWLSGTDWDKESSPPSLPREVIEETRKKYLEIEKILC